VVSIREIEFRGDWHVNTNAIDYNGEERMELLLLNAQSTAN
jgi:hypothetical protein